MRVRASQVLFAISFILFIIGSVYVALAVFFLGLTVMTLEFAPKPKMKEEEKEEEIIKPID